MTSEVAILNKSAIALAADSKVTVGVSGWEKTYDTVNKLFTLSKYHPVGIMIYGNAEFMRFPWETIIKRYRGKLGISSKRTIREYGRHFIASLTADYKFSVEDQKRNVFSILIQLHTQISYRVQHRVWKLAKIQDDKVYQTELLEILNDDLQRLKGRKTLNFAKGLGQRAFEKRYSKEINLSTKEAFGTGLSVATKRRLKTLSYLHIAKDDFSPSCSGIVIAGFGEKEHFPSLVAYRLDGVIAGKIKIAEESEADVSREMKGAVMPFAQGKMVYRFMEGIDPDYQRFLEGVIPNLFLENCLNVIDQYVGGQKSKKERIKKQVIKALGSNLEKFFERASHYRQAKFVDPIIEMVVLLPKEELANMAESLVNLTSLKKRVSTETETVGGPIDVAVISKGDGFVWIKRKHYFKRELNPSFFENYFR